MRAVGFYRAQRPGAAASRAVSALGARPQPAEEIELYCRQNSHQLIGMFAPPDAGDVAVDRYRQLVESFTGPNARLALVLIPDSSHLADDMETFVARLLELHRLGAEVRCTNPDRPDPLQNAEEHLGLKGRSPGRQRRIRESIMAKASRGQVLGRTPYGYEAGVDGQLKLVPDEARVVRNVFEWYAGQPPKWKEMPTGGLGLRLIAQRLNDQGLRTRQGFPWSQVSVAGMLRNRTYLGTYTRYGVRISGSHEPIVDRDLYQRVQAILQSRRPVRRAAAEEPFLLSGLVRCGVCGRGVFGLTRRRGWKRKDGTGVEKSYRYYECPSREPTREKQGAVAHPSWRADDLEKAVRDELGRQTSHTNGAGHAVPAAAGPDPKAVAAAEREFNRALRAVAAGYGHLDDLQGPLAALERARRPQAGLPESGARDLMALVNGEDEAAAHQAIAYLVQRIVVFPDSIEIIRNSGAGAPATPAPGG